MKLMDLAKRLGLELRGDGEVDIVAQTGFASFGEQSERYIFIDEEFHSSK